MKKVPVGVPKVDAEVDRLLARKKSTLSRPLRESFGMRNFGPSARISAWAAVKSQRDYRAKVSRMAQFKDVAKQEAKAANSKKRYENAVVQSVRAVRTGQPRWPAGRPTGGQFKPKG